MELTMGLPSLPLTWWAGKVGGSTDIGDYQIAHLPPLAASAGAASWAAEYKKNTRCYEAHFVKRHANTPPQSR